MAEGAVFDCFDREENIVQELPKMKEYYVGIDYGTTNPLAPIHVQGHNNNIDPAKHKVSLYTSNVIYTGSYYTSDSDIRIKTNIQRYCNHVSIHCNFLYE